MSIHNACFYWEIRKILSVFFLFGFYGPFKNISLISIVQRWVKTGETEEKNHLIIHKQNLALPRDLSEARTTAVTNLMD